MAGFLFLQNLGLADAPVGVGSVVIYTQPFLVALGAWLLRGERLRLWQVAGMVLGWLGVAIVVAGELDVGATPRAAVVLLLLSAVSWAVGTLIFLGVPPDLSVLDLLLVMDAYGLVPIAAWSPSESGRRTRWTGARRCSSPRCGRVPARASVGSGSSSCCCAGARPGW